MSLHAMEELEKMGFRFTINKDGGINSAIPDRAKTPQAARRALELCKQLDDTEVVAELRARKTGRSNVPAFIAFLTGEKEIIDFGKQLIFAIRDGEVTDAHAIFDPKHPETATVYVWPATWVPKGGD